MAQVDASKTILYAACICCRNGIWTEVDKLIGGDLCDFKCNLLCIEEQLCCNLQKLQKQEFLLPGVPEGKICQIGLGCCAIALQMPQLPQIVKCSGHYCCCAQSAAFPFDAENPPMCAVCFISLFPSIGIAMTWADAMAGKGVKVGPK